MADADSPGDKPDSRLSEPAGALAESSSEGAARGKARWSWVATPLKLAFGLGLLAYLILSGRLGLTAFGDAHIGWDLVAAAALIVGALFPMCVRWWLLLRYQGIEVKFRRAVEMTWIGYFFGLFLPGAVSGDLARGYYIIKDTPHARSRAASTIILDRGLGLYSLFFIGLVAAAVLHARGQTTPMIRAMTVCTVILVGSMTAALVLLWLPRSRRWLLGLLPSRLRAELDAGLGDYCTQAASIAVCFAVSLAASLLNVLAFLPAARVLGEQLPALSIFLAGPLIILANSLPISPGGLGVAESASDALLHAFGFGHGAEVMLLLRGVIVVSALPGAVLYAMHARRAK